MPVLPQLREIQGGGNLSLPRMSPGVFQPVVEGLDVFARIQNAADNAEASQLQQTTSRQLEGVIQQAKDSYGDPDEFQKFATTQSGEVVKNALNGARNDNVKALLQSKLADEIVKQQNEVKHHFATLNISKARGNFDLAIDEAVNRRISTDDPVEQSRIDSQMSNNLADLIRNGVYDSGEGIKKIVDYRNKILMGSADVQIRSNPEGFLADEQLGKWNDINLDTRMKLSEKARGQIERAERQADKITKDVKDIVMRDLNAAANQGKIRPEDMADLLAGKNPYVKPSEARTLNEVNSNPPTGEGSDAVKAIATEYYLSPRTLPHINATRAKLRQLQTQLGKPNPMIMKLANELQSDQTTMENQGISREANAIAAQNRGITNAITQYEAGKTPGMPGLERLLGNRSEQDKAKIRLEGRRNGIAAAEKLADQLSKGVRSGVEAVPQKMKDVMQYGE